MRLSSVLLASSYVIAAAANRALYLQKTYPSLPLGLWSALSEQDAARHEITIAQYDGLQISKYAYTSLTRHPRSGLRQKYPAQTLEVQVDHFDSDNNATFPLRYWYDAQYYKDGGPVFVLDGGETSGEDRLSFLDHGILKILSQATNGLAVVLEHRYYGESWPVRDLSTDNMRFLTTHQALADNAYFTKHATFSSLSDKENKRLRDAKWIHYGGSYAGAKVALLRKLYPDTVFGAIASSAVTAAITDYWQYFEGIRLHADQECISAIEQSVSLADVILALNSTAETKALKNLLGVPNVTHIQDVVSLLTYPLGAWQAKNWDPSVSSTGFDDFCDDLLGKSTKSKYTPMKMESQHPLFQHHQSQEEGSPSFYLSNYARYIRKGVAPFCKEHDQDACFGTFDPKGYQKHSLKETWRSWTWQYCTEWGFLQSAPPRGVPSLLSRHIDLSYTHMVCRLAFPPGKHASMPSQPNTTIINQYGGLDFEYDRVAFIDGSYDPWIYATPHSPNAKKRKSTLLRPFELIKGGVHHWDENGLPEKGASLIEEPEEIRKVHAREVEFVKSWLGMK